MSTDIISAPQINIQTASDGPVAIGQSKDSVLSSTDHILAVISELHVCYDYCAAWKETPRNEIAVSTEAKPQTRLSTSTRPCLDADAGMIAELSWRDF